MGYEIEGGCRMDCPDCHGCSRRFKKYKIWHCDECREETNRLYYASGLDGRELCEDCYKEQFISKICDDCDDETCNECGSEAEELYLCDGRWLCPECLMNQAERVDTED